MCVLFICVHMHMCVYVCGAQRSTSGVWCSSKPSASFIETVSHWPRAHNAGWPVSPTIWLSLPPQSWDYKEAPLVQQALYRLSCPPAFSNLCFKVFLRVYFKRKEAFVLLLNLPPYTIYVGTEGFGLSKVFSLYHRVMLPDKKVQLALCLLALLLFHSYFFGMKNLFF